MTFEQWWDTVAKTPAPDTFKNWEESCRQAWEASQPAQPDCRTCFYGDTPDEFNEYQWKCLSLRKGCINGNQYKPVERVVLWRTE